MTDRPHRPLPGIAFCVFSLLCFATQDALLKQLTSAYPVLQILVLRSVSVLLLLVPGALLFGVPVLARTHHGAMVARGGFAFLAFYSYYVALANIPLADAAAVYMTAPLFVTMLSVIVLGERVGVHRAAAVIVGFTAVVVMVNPTSGLLRVAAVLPLMSALSYAAIPIISRRVGLTEHPVTMGIYATVVFGGLCFAATLIIYQLPEPGAGAGLADQLLARWIQPSMTHALLIATSGVIFTIALLSITQAYRIAAVSSVSPFEYSYLLWAALLGYFVFGDLPSLRTVVGGLVVVAAGCYVIYRERATRNSHG